MCARFVPHSLTPEQREDILAKTLSWWPMQTIFFFNYCGRWDLVFCLWPRTKRQSSEWTGETSPRPKKLKFHRSRAKIMLIIFFDSQGEVGGRGSTVVKVLCYKSEGRWFDPSWCQWIFHWHKNPSDRTMALGSTQPLTEMSARSISWGKGGGCVRLTTYHHPVPLSRNLGTLTS